MTNKRISFVSQKIWAFPWTDYSWDDLKLLLRKTFLGPCFHFRQNGYRFLLIIFQNTSRKMYTFAKEQMDIVKTGAIFNNVVAEEINLKI
jgi:hypothetical protein